MPIQTLDKTDAAGNRLTVEATGEIKLFLAAEQKIRNVGKFFIENGVKIFRAKKKLSHIFKKNDSWGLNWDVMDMLLDTDLIQIVCPEENKSYQITKKDAREKGSFLFFKAVGFERQFFVPRKEFLVEGFVAPVSQEKIENFNNALVEAVQTGKPMSFAEAKAAFPELKKEVSDVSGK